MNAAVVLLEELHRQGKTVHAVGDILRIKPAVTDAALLQRLREHKPELMALLAAPSPTSQAADLATLDRERFEADLAIGRGYDCDESHPEHAAFVERQTAEYETAKAIGRHCEATGTDLVEYLERFGFRLIDEMEGSR